MVKIIFFNYKTGLVNSTGEKCIKKRPQETTYDMFTGAFFICNPLNDVLHFDHCKSTIRPKISTKKFFGIFLGLSDPSMLVLR